MWTIQGTLNGTANCVCHSPRQVLNERAIAVMSRMSDKLTGRDFPVELRNGADHDTIPVQVPSSRMSPNSQSAG